jgi:hypothetical protein
VVAVSFHDGGGSRSLWNVGKLNNCHQGTEIVSHFVTTGSRNRKHSKAQMVRNVW